MARGWESKAVEEQIGAAEAGRELRARPVLSPEEIEAKARREGLELSRARLVAALEAAADARYREQLGRALEHLDAEIAALGPEPLQ